MRSASKTDIEDKRVFVRVDFNVPVSESKVLDDFKITSVMSTIRYIHSANPKRIVIGSHFGRPNGRYVEELSLKPVYEVLNKIVLDEFGAKLAFCELSDLNRVDDTWVLLENLRFYKAEESSDDEAESAEYTRLFKDNMDVAIIDSFGCLHRECGSIQRTGLRSFPGVFMQKELEFTKYLLERNIDVMILGGKKVSDKSKLLMSLGKRAKCLIILGGLSYPFLKYRLNKEVGNSIVGDVPEGMVQMICDVFDINQTEVILPIDFVVINDGKAQIMSEIPPSGCALDIGPATIRLIQERVSKAESVFWNGPPGVFEQRGLSDGTKALVGILESMKMSGKRCLCGGGETSAAIRMFGKYENFTHVSTGGGVLMKLLNGEDLPVLEFLLHRPSCA
ncbi:phosphoglycerate kinase [Ordospora colligata]|uniref:Phosphoglycerate kinase n=1 Tax=Ordospora colligata OC4 TaxID=1354746 RepID=A0A0B2UNN4_9MICR|nr:phosphoglycerate kinase [Ordospora colligata OC4]KHN70570.1 phosphoglycerate kinase [Ordospora colligata OC4]TBU17320.1 phosphoglycerate kinase [Ordospora colligata]TBU17570.1 phosphoglycerate kinase [Ordospora colligata]TBU19750.1 phosphoglycerate kinase [Ordospora colligata]